MNQKDQISLIQYIFDEFDVDWEEGDRENIKVSVQQPSLDYQIKHQEEIQKISSTLISAGLDDSILSNYSDSVFIGVTDENHICKSIPFEDHDVPMNAIVTPKRFITINL